ncbi:MAG TPA: hypothetical protein VHE30_21245 [Polyangiaceae bacterium]|nr:hypothetical protein [Polyangiaceae bacterium]
MTGYSPGIGIRQHVQDVPAAGCCLPSGHCGGAVDSVVLGMVPGVGFPIPVGYGPPKDCISYPEFPTVPAGNWTCVFPALDGGASGDAAVEDAGSDGE